MGTLRDLQKTSFSKLEKLTNPSYEVLKKMIQDKKGKASERLHKEELLAIREYLADRNAEPTSFATVFGQKWDLQFPLERFGDKLSPAIIDLLLKLFDQQESTGTSLIPIKGISKVMQAKLRKLSVFDTPGLLLKGKTRKKREALAASLDVDVKLVTSWVKQADLWRIDGMTPDTAYLLVQVGVRHVEDLARVDARKAWQIMERLSWAQPDFSPVDQAALAGLIQKAGEYAGYYAEQKAAGNNIAFCIETDEAEPVFLFREGIEEGIDLKSSGKIIEEGLGFLKDVVLALPLPHLLGGTVYMRKAGEKDSDKVCFPDAQVEIDGISSPSADKTEADKNPTGQTDSTGRFLIVMPDKYNLQEVVTITISQGANKQKFVRSASDIINAVKAQEILNRYDSLDAIAKFIETDESKLEQLDWLKSLLKKPMSEEDKLRVTREIADLEAKVPDIKKEIDLQKAEYQRIKAEILASDKTSNDLERILNNLLANNNLKADLKNFVLTEEIFKGYRTDLKKALPSVKLMGNDDQAVHLSTDSAPSRVFNYGMLQRLVEPAIKPFAGTKQARETLTDPVDVMNFKMQMYSDPDKFPKMSSLGIGYVLNMHQAWVPDGFALGSLLYSLVLAPGEEQRLIVRETTQSYTVADDAEGMDAVSENYAFLQTDDTTAAYNRAVNQLATASSNYSYTTKSGSAGGGLGLGIVGSGVSAMLGLSGSYSQSSGKGSAGARQSNSHNEASSAAQGFQHSIKSASDKIAQSKRVSVRTATSEENTSVATKIIANHNHSHAMTIQYWEVMRRYRLETCIDGVDLVLFVPLKLIRFLPAGQNYLLEQSNLTAFNRSVFNKRYNMLLQHSDTLAAALPYKYRTGLNLVKRYAAYPEWEMEQTLIDSRTLTLTFRCFLLPFDDVKVSLVLKNGKGIIAGGITCERHDLSAFHKTTRELRQQIQDIRNRNNAANPVARCTFTLPGDIADDDLSYIRIDHSCEDFNYELFQDYASLEDEQRKAYDKMQDKLWDLAKDYKGRGGDRDQIRHFKSLLPEAYHTPFVTLSVRTLIGLGVPTISDVNLTLGSGYKPLGAMLSSSSLHPSVTISIKNSCPVLRYSELQEMEALMHHVASDTLRYSQVVWRSLSEDERAMMLERYTIDMNFDNMVGETGDTKGNNDIPLLNCVNVKKLLGFYGNCILLPFTYPKSLADKLGKTAAEVQDSLYRYHSNCFRVPSTTISLPTDGMIGEAVLGETNVSELIDLTRFWNWKDSPIDSMELDSDYLNTTDYLANKTTADITALNLTGAAAPSAVTVPDLITALLSKNDPATTNITGLEYLKEILNAGTTSTSTGRDKVIDASKDLAMRAMEALKPTAKEENKTENSKPEEKKSENSKPEENKNEEKKPEEKKPEENKNEEKKPAENK